MGSKQPLDWIDKLAQRWDHEAHDLERAAKASREMTPIERRLQEMHARAKRGAAAELRIEKSKVVNRGG